MKSPSQVAAERIKELRIRHGWTQQRLADRLAELGYTDREEVELTREDVYFRLPAELR